MKVKIIVNLVEIIKIIPEFLQFFIPGFIFIILLTWFYETKLEISAIIVWSILISVLIKSFYSVIHLIILRNWDCSESLKILVFSVTGAFLSFLVFKIKQSQFFKRHLHSLTRKTPNNDIFLDLFDYEKPIMLKIHLHSSQVYYYGQLCINNKEWISLMDYEILNESDDSVVSDRIGKKGTIIIKVDDMYSIEVRYEDDSKVWHNIHPYEL